jgi:hypothetical protein
MGTDKTLIFTKNVVADRAGGPPSRLEELTVDSTHRPAQTSVRNHPCGHPFTIPDETKKIQDVERHGLRDTVASPLQFAWRSASTSTQSSKR